MPATFTWIIEWMECVPQEGQFTDVVINAGWRCNGAQSAGDPAVEYTTTLYGSASFPQPTEGGSFTPYADLTQDQVLGWCWANGVDKEAIQAAAQANIDNQINPPVIQPPLPWAPVPAPAA